MYIKSYKCTRFAGLKDMNLEFDRGINVILGPNESGKSSIIEGMHSTLFKDIKLRKNNNADKDFSFRFMPKPDGDFIDGELVLKSNKGPYKISKEWGSSENVQLTTPEGSLLKNEKDIKDKLNDLLSFGESTYSNIVFAKQRDVKAALFNIINNSEITQEINDLLRMALMELDGVSIDSIQKNIEDEMDDLYKRWNQDKNYPDNNRGVNNPYKVGLGKIVESYYNRENLRLSMEEADRTEKEFEAVNNNIKKAKDKKDVLSKEKFQLEKIEDDVNNRSILNAEMKSVDKDLEDLMEANREWPKTDQLLEQLDKQLADLRDRKGKLDQEKKDLEKCKEKEKLEKSLKKIEEIESSIKTIEEELANISLIKKEDMDKLTDYGTSLLKLETTMEAGKMIGILKKAGDKAISIKKDFGPKEALELEQEFQANGLISINYGDEFELEIKTGEIDFEELDKEYSSLKADHDGLLKDLKIDSVEIGKLTLQKRQEKENQVAGLKRELEIALDDCRKEEIQLRLKELKEIKSFRVLEDIEKELEEVNEKQIDLSANKKSKKAQVKIWQEKYKDHDSLFDLVIDKRSNHKDMEKKLEGLKPLPKEFLSIGEFKDRLTWLKDELGVLEIELDDLNDNYYETKGNLLEDTYEELKKEYLQAEKTFDRNIKRGEKLLEIEKVFLETKQRLASNPMEPLVNEFARLLDIITKGSYKTGVIDEEFNIKLENPNGEIPMELLSAGTHDSVTLALRFSLLKHIFNDMGGYVVLDDCLVDLDPVRKEESIKLIHDFAKDYQIIFTTCDPQTADMLGGRIIEL